jgi:hypothetical protein
MAQDPRKTVPMGKNGARPLASMRKTEPMGAARDTVRDPPRNAPDMQGLLPDGIDPAVLDGEAARVRTGDFVRSSKANPKAQEALRALRGAGTVPMRPAELPESDRTEAGQIVIGKGRRARTMLNQKVDLSRVDPRRAPTQKVDRRFDAYLPRDNGGFEPSHARRGLSVTSIGLIVVGALALVALVLGVLVARQRGLL